MKATDYKHISDLLVEKGTKAALGVLLDSRPTGKVHQQAKLLMVRVRRLEEQQITGTIDHKDYQLEQNRIQLALMNLLSKAGENKKAQRTLKGVFSALILLLLIGIGGYFLSQPKQEIEVRLSALQASRIAMQSSKEANLYLGQEVEALSLYNFKSVEIETDSVADDKVSLLNAVEPLQITPLPDISNVGLHLGAVRLENLSFEDSAQIVISQVEGAPERFRIQVKQSQPFSGRLNYAGPLPINSAYVRVESGSNINEYYEPFEWTLRSPEKEAREIRFTGDPANFMFEFTLRDSMLEKELLVSDLSFFQPEQQQVKSSILSGSIDLRETDRSTLKTIPLREGDRIDLALASNILLRRLSLRPEGILLEAGGKLRTLYTYNSGDRRLRNPSRLTWLWHNQKLVFIGTSLLVLALLYGLIGKGSDRLIHFLKY